MLTEYAFISGYYQYNFIIRFVCCTTRSNKGFLNCCWTIL